MTNSLSVETRITLPRKVKFNNRVGGNLVVQLALPALETNVIISDSPYPDFASITTGLPAPFNELLLRRPGKRASVPDAKPCLKLKTTALPASDEDLAQINVSTTLVWEAFPADTQVKEATSIREDWRGKFRFIEEDREANIKGLRSPQIGALHAISAHFAVGDVFEPATVVLPTGTGKTETMLSALIYRRCNKLFVIVPSDSLRNQIFEKFLSLGYLPELRVVPYDIERPRVALVKNGIKSASDAHTLARECNVLIATASALNSCNEEVLAALCRDFSDLFIDEAHHVTARTWRTIRERFKEKRVVQFTATPFRNDKGNLGGRIIFNYTMGAAQKADYFKHIRLVSIEEYHEDKRDLAIASAAVSMLREDLVKGHDHLLMARVDSIERAKTVLQFYQALAADFNPLLVHSRLKKTETREALAALFNRESRIVVCVNMLGEGFDLPNLKIAAIHDGHKSLAISLQFIGRFTRLSQNVGDAAVIINIADPSVENRLEQLYAQGADWDSILRRLSEQTINREISLQQVIDGLKNRGDLHKQISLWNLSPSFSTQVFATRCEQWTPEHFDKLLPKNTEYWHAINDDESLLVLLAIQETPVKWGSYKELSDIVYKLLIAHWDKDRAALFIYTNDYSWFRVEKLAPLLAGNNAQLVNGAKIFNVFNGVELPLVKNLGAATIGAISFTQYFGPNVTDGLAQIEKSQSNLSNIAGLGYENGERVIWGCSEKKGKVWSVKSGSISDWRDWCRSAWDKISALDADEANITRDFLRPLRISNRHNSVAIAAQWGEYTIAAPEDRVSVLFGVEETNIYLVDIQTIDADPTQNIQVKICSEENSSTYELVIGDELTGGYQYRLVDGEPLYIKYGNAAPRTLEEHLISDPWVIQYADGAYSYNNYLIKVDNAGSQYAADDLEPWDWTSTDIRKESMNKSMDKNSIQYLAYQHIDSNYDVILNDDDAGEAADLVALKEIDSNTIALCLVHCKYSSEDQPGARIKDMYEVCGQAQKSIRWKHTGIPKLVDHLLKRETKWQKQGHTRFLKGNNKSLIYLKNKARTSRIQFEIVIVQPGLSKEMVSPEILKLLGTTELYIKKTTQGKLRVISSK